MRYCCKNIHHHHFENDAGKLLSQCVRDIYTDFMAAMDRWQHIDYDVLDVDAKQFVTDFHNFRSVIRELERRLGQVVVAAFDDAANVTSTFKLLDSFEGLLEREAIAAELERKHFQLLLNYSDDLNAVRFSTSDGVVAEIPLRSPRKLFHFIIKKSVERLQYSCTGCVVRRDVN